MDALRFRSQGGHEFPACGFASGRIQWCNFTLSRQIQRFGPGKSGHGVSGRQLEKRVSIKPNSGTCTSTTG
jgi:hypothetical protein